MKSSDKKLILLSIDKTVAKNNLNEFVISIIDWLSTESQLSVKDILRDEELKDLTSLKPENEPKIK